MVNLNINTESSTFFLFARPSFIEGVARIVDLGGTLSIYNESGTPEDADLSALFSDWKAVGEDLKSAIGKYERTRTKASTTEQ